MPFVLSILQNMSLLCYFLLIISSAIFSSSVPFSKAHRTKALSFGVVHGSKYSSVPIKRLQSQTYPDGGYYLMEIEIGSPPIKTYGLIDSGSDLVWLQCTTCFTDRCYPQQVPMFDPYQSYTYASVLCHDSICQKLPANTSICENIQTAGCIYSYRHATRNTRSRFQGSLSTETISLSRGFSINARDIPVSIDNIVFGCGDHNVDGGELSINTGGIIGLSRGPLSLVSQLGFKEFSYCLPDPSSDISGKITFGEDYLSKSIEKDVVKTPLIKRPDSSFYYLNLEGATVAGKRIQNRGNSTKKGNILMDSGRMLNYLDQEFYSSLEAAVKNATNITSEDGPVGYYNLCYSELPKTEVVFHFTGANVTLTPMNLFVKLNDYLFCFAMLPEKGPNPFIYGNVAQRNFQVTYDLANEFVSFGTTKDCGQHRL